MRSLVVMNEIFWPSGENCGDTFMPARSTIGARRAAVGGDRKDFRRYGARKPTNGANEYAISLLSGDHEKLSTY